MFLYQFIGQGKYICNAYVKQSEVKYVSALINLNLSTRYEARNKKIYMPFY